MRKKGSPSSKYSIKQDLLAVIYLKERDVAKVLGKRTVCRPTLLEMGKDGTQKLDANRLEAKVSSLEKYRDPSRETGFDINEQLRQVWNTHRQYPLPTLYFLAGSIKC